MTHEELLVALTDMERERNAARADLIGIPRANELLTRENIRLAGRIRQLEGGDLVGALMTTIAVRDARIAKLEAVLEAAKAWRDVDSGYLEAAERLESAVADAETP